MIEYLITYAKYTNDKQEGMMFNDVYFAGIEQTKEAAEVLGRECVNTVKGGTVIVKINKVTKPYSILEVMYDIIDQQEKFANELAEAQQILNAPSRKKKK